MDLPLLSSYEQTLVNYWLDCGTATPTSGGLTPITWSEIRAWASQFYTEQYIEWVEHPRPLRSDGLPDERYKPIITPLLATQCTLTDWELQMIKKMSQEYVSEYSCNSPSRQCPKEVFEEDLTEDDKLANANAIEDAFNVLFSNNNTPAVEAVTNT